MEAALLAIIALACPLGMLLMGVCMWKGVGRKRADRRAPGIAELRTEHERLGGEIARLERAEASGIREAAKR